VFRHHLYFATTLLDRVYLYSGQHDKFEIVCHDTEILHEIFTSGRGALMLGAHLGSFEFMRASAAHRMYGFTSNMMMYEDNARKIATVLEGLDKHKARRIIPIGRVDALLIAKERLDRGELVGILGDRAVSKDQLVWVPFLGQPAPFPAGPFLAAAALQTPVILFCCLYGGGNRYELHFERLAERMTITRRQPAELEAWVRRYAARLEHYCRLSPYNWFNFYDFWGDQSDHRGTPPGTG
jgi:predicted LPLAT superfamily acyltransferase